MANNLTSEKLSALVADYLKSNKICVTGFEASKDNILGLLDKIGKTITIDGVYESELDFMNGETLPLGKTIEEYFEDFVPPEEYTANAGIENITRKDATARPVKYSYTQGRKKWSTTKPYDDIERAFATEEGAAQALTGLVLRLNQAYQMWRDELKKELLGKYAAKADEIMSTTAVYATKTAYAVGTALKSASSNGVVGIVFNAIEASSTLTWAEQVAAGNINVVDMVTSIAEPTDTITGNTFIKRVKKYARKAKFKNHENLNGTLILPTPKSNLRLVINTYLMPDLEVDTWAGAFHKDLVALPASVSETDSFGSNSDVIALLIDDRGVKVHNSYQAIRETQLGDDDALKLVKHSEDTAFYSANTFIHVFKKA